MRNVKVIEVSVKGNLDLNPGGLLSTPIAAGSNDDNGYNRRKSSPGLVQRCVVTTSLHTHTTNLYFQLVFLYSERRRHQHVVFRFDFVLHVSLEDFSSR